MQIFTVIALNKLAVNLWEKLKNTADINTFKVDFQFIQYPFKVEVDNTKLLQELMGLLNLVCSFEIDLFLLQSNQLLQKDESVLSI